MRVQPGPGSHSATSAGFKVGRSFCVDHSRGLEGDVTEVPPRDVSSSSLVHIQLGTSSSSTNGGYSCISVGAQWVAEEPGTCGMK